MTKQQRNQLLKKAYNLLDEANSEEQDSLNNWAENLLYSERYERAETRAKMIEEAVSSVEELRDNLEAVLNEDF